MGSTEFKVVKHLKQPTIISHMKTNSFAQTWSQMTQIQAKLSINHQ
jgi:hypothetical protein